MLLTICEKHQKKQITQKVLVTTNVCINRYCPNAYSLICQQCKTEHRDHALKVLTLEDISDLITPLLKNPSKLSVKYLNESIDVMKKIKLIKQFKRKIDNLECQLVRQAVKLIEVTQTLLNQYAVSREKVIELAQKLQKISQNQSFYEFKDTCNRYFSHIQYLPNKQKMQFGNITLKEKEDQRKRLLEINRRKIEQVKDYSMKIIEVILHHYESDDEQDQDYLSSINHKKKYYKTLKEQIICESKPDLEIDQEDEQQSKSTTVSANQKKFKQCYDNYVQTDDLWITTLTQEVKMITIQREKERINWENNQRQMQEQLKELKKDQARIDAQKQKIWKENEKLNSEIRERTSEGQLLNRQLSAMKYLLQSQKKIMRGFEKRLLQNTEKRNTVRIEKQEILRKIIQVYQTK